MSDAVQGSGMPPARQASCPSCRPRWRVTNDDDDSQQPGSGCRRICVTDGNTEIRCYEADVAAKLAAHLNSTRFTIK